MKVKLKVNMNESAGTTTFGMEFSKFVEEEKKCGSLGEGSNVVL